MKSQLLIIIILFLFVSAQAQRNNHPIDNSDTLRYINFSDSTKYWYYNNNTRLITLGDKAKILSEVAIVDKLVLSEETTVWTLDDKLKLWATNDSIAVWQVHPKTKDFKKVRNADFQKENDSLKLWYPGNPYLITSIRDTMKFWKVETRTHSWKPLNEKEEFEIKDSINLWKINDTTKIALYKNESHLWKRYATPKYWELSSSTKVWAIDRQTEIWDTDGRIKLWSRLSSAGTWSQFKDAKHIVVNDSTDIWILKDEQFIKKSRLAVEAWRVDKQTKMYSLNDSLNVWKEIPPVKPIIIVPPKKKKNFELSVINNNTKKWKLKDGSIIINMNDTVELWKENKTAKSWMVNDTTTIWLINNKTQFTIINNSSKVWAFVDSTKTWMPSQSASYMQLDSFTRIWRISPILKLEINKDKSTMWDVNRNVKLADRCKDGMDKQLRINDTTSVWMVEKGLILHITNDDNVVWKADKNEEVWAINDTTKFWRVNEDTRIALLNDSVAVWKYEEVEGALNWVVRDDIEYLQFNDSVCRWPLATDVHFWRYGNSYGIWRIDNSTVVLNISDSLKLYTYIPEPPKKAKAKEKKKRYWKLGGDGNLHFSQIYYKNWIKFIPNKMSALALLKLQAKYSKNNTKFENIISLRHERLSTSEYTDVMRGQDKIEFNTRLGQRAFNHWYYSFNFYFLSQMLEGYNYPNDSVAVTKFMSPGFMNYSIGMDFKPTKNFSLYLAPASYKLSYVLDTTLSNTVKKYKIEEGSRVRKEIGGEMILELKFDIMKNISCWNKLRLFSNYKEHPENVDIRWEANLNMKVNKYVNATIRTILIYDDDIPIPLMERNSDGKTVQRVDEHGNKLTGPRMQFNEVLSVGLTYSF